MIKVRTALGHIQVDVIPSIKIRVSGNGAQGLAIFAVMIILAALISVNLRHDERFLVWRSK